MNYRKSYIQKTQSQAKIILTILIAPLTVSLFADIIIQSLKGIILPNWQYYFSAILVFLFAVLLFLSYTNLFNEIITSLNLFFRNNRLKKPNVLVLDGTIFGGEEIPPRPIFSNHSPHSWKHVLSQEKKWKVNVGPIDQINNHQVIINPFGEIYPEADPKYYSTFKQICEFVFNGGIFVNVAGVPFWYYHDPKDPLFVEKRANAGYLYKELRAEGEVIVLRRLFMDKFPQLSNNLSDSERIVCVQSETERQLFGEIAGAGGDNCVTMFRAYPANLPGAIPLLLSQNHEQWLIISLQYGDGYFLLAGLDLTGENNTGFHKVVAAIKGWVHNQVNHNN